MDPFTMAGLVLGKLELTSDQLAQLRALNTRYFTEVAALQRREGGAAGGMAALHASIASEIRELLTDEQRVTFDRNFPRVWEREIEPQGGAEAGGAP